VSVETLPALLPASHWWRRRNLSVPDQQQVAYGTADHEGSKSGLLETPYDFARRVTDTVAGDAMLFEGITCGSRSASGRPENTFQQFPDHRTGDGGQQMG
jgi:hypothetical protein